MNVPNAPAAPPTARGSGPNALVLTVIGVVIFLVFAGCVVFAQIYHTPTPTYRQAMDKDNYAYNISSSMDGVWETKGSADDKPCRWMRLSKEWTGQSTIEAEAKALVDSGTVLPNQTERVRVHQGEYFVSWGCLPWLYID